MLRDGASLEAVLAYLRSAGATLGESAILVSERASLGLDEATNAVLYSETWSDRLDANIETNRLFWAAVQEHGKPLPDGSYDLTEWLAMDDDEAGR